MKNMILSTNYLFLDYDDFRPPAFDSCVRDVPTAQVFLRKDKF